MELFDAVKGRRSIRQFKQQSVPRDFIHKILDAARWAPSAGNLQPWEFVIVEDQKRREQLAAACLNQGYIAEAPVVIVACSDVERSAIKFGDRGRYFYALIDTAAAVQNLQLAAYGLGLGSYGISAFDDEKVSKIIGLPDGVVPVSVIPIGFPTGAAKAPPRTNLANIVHFDEYGKLERNVPVDPDVHPTPTITEPLKKKSKGLIDIFK